MKDYKLGLIARADNGGLGVESWEFYKHLQPDKVLCVMAGYENFPERFPGSIKTDLNPTDGQVRDFLEGLDSVFTVETPYNWSLFSMARDARIRSAMKVNWEWAEFHSFPDLYVFPNEWHTDEAEKMMGQGRVVIPLPIDSDRFKFRERKQAETFLHVIGHDAGYDRNGTAVFAQAIPLVKTQGITFLIRSQIPIHRWKGWGAYKQCFEDRRVCIVDVEEADNATLYQSADVLVMPRRYGGQSLTMEEAAMCGVPQITTWMQPQNDMFLLSSVFINSEPLTRVRIKQEIEYANPNPAELARRIDDVARMDLGSLSREARRAVEGRSWPPWIDVLRPR